MNDWTGRTIIHRNRGRGVVTADRSAEDHTQGLMLVRFEGEFPTWVSPSLCTLAAEA